MLPGPQHARAIRALLALLARLPDELLTLHGDEYTTFIVAVESLRGALRAIEDGDDRMLGAASVAEILEDVTQIRELLTRCPDEVVAAATAGLEFINDEALRASIRGDIAAANTALLNGEWKAATVLAGSACEALLLWRVLKSSAAETSAAAQRAVSTKRLQQQVRSGNPHDWVFHELIEVAAELSVIKPQTRDQLQLAKDFRNLIHPGRALRLGQVCDRGTALSALAGLEHAIRDLGA